MTSKNLFPELLKQNMKRRLWPLALSILAAVFSLPVLSILAMDNWTERLINGRTDLADIKVSFCNTVAGVGNPAVFICAVALAVICGINSMTWLHSKGKTDLYGSLPVKRTELFGAAYLNGLLFFAVPFFISQAVTVILGIVRGMFDLSFLPGILLSSVYVMIFYFAIYTLACLSAVLSGNTVVSAVLSAVVLFIAPLGYLAYYSYASVFFRNFYADSESILWRYLSPVLTYGWIAVTKLSSESEMNNTEFSNPALLGAALMLALGIIVLWLILGLIKRRPAESAGNALSFKWIRPILKIVLMVIGTLLIALIFYEISPSGSIGWLIFGFIAGSVLIHSVTEIVCEFDFKACLHHPLSFVAGSVISALLILSFMLDFFGYDSYLPPVSMVESAALSGYDLQPSITYNDPDERGYYIGSEEYRLKNMNLRDLEDVYALSKKGIEFSNRLHGTGESGRLERIFEDPEGSKDTENIRYTSITVRFRLKTGNSIYRCYYIDLSDAETFEAYSKIFGTKEYKEAVYPVLKAKISDLGKLHLNGNDSSSSLILTEKEREKLLRVYREDMLKFEGEKLKSELPCAMITSIRENRQEKTGYYDDQEYDFVIYPSFTGCMAFLEEAEQSGNFKKGTVTGVDVNMYNMHSEVYDSRNVSYEMPKDASKIDELMSSAIRGAFFREADIFMDDLSDNDDGFSMEVFFDADPADANSFSSSSDYILPGGNVPEFLEKDLDEGM